MNDKITLRKATPDDLALLVHWEQQPHVLNAIPEGDWQWESELQRDPPWREQLIAELDGRPIGFVQIIDPAEEETHYWGDVGKNWRAIDIWIGNFRDLGKGYGTRIMNMVLEKCFAQKTVQGILIDPLARNTAVHRFYERLGFVFVEEQMMDDHLCRIYRLLRNQWKKHRNPA